jgi:hypothetical protein
MKEIFDFRHSAYAGKHGAPHGKVKFQLCYNHRIEARKFSHFSIRID